MHELFITESIFESVARSLPVDVAPEYVTAVEVTVGKLDAVIPETLQFLFDAIKTGKGFPRAELALTEEPVECVCQTCRNDFDLYDPVFICPYCGSVKILVSKGKGITLTRIEADVPD